MIAGHPIFGSCCCCCDGDLRRRRGRRIVDDFDPPQSVDSAADDFDRQWKIKGKGASKCADFFRWLRGPGPEPGAVYKAMVANANIPGAVTLAFENADKVGVYQCLKRAGTKLAAVDKRGQAQIPVSAETRVVFHLEGIRNISVGGEFETTYAEALKAASTYASTYRQQGLEKAFHYSIRLAGGTGAVVAQK